MFEFLENTDRSLFLFLNELHTPFWDAVMSFCTAKLTWVPLYVVLAVWVYAKHGKKIFTIVIAISLLILCSDQLSVALKNSVKRYRPCHNIELSEKVHLLKGCGGQYGFVSSHAANVFALVGFLILLMKPKKSILMLLLCWAMIVSYSRIYAGVHYPADIFWGAFLGATLSIAFYRLYLGMSERFVKS